MSNKIFEPLNPHRFEDLKSINDVKFTCREIEIISFFVCGRSVKKIATFFSIAPKTVENHSHNIMLKLGCNSRESIIDFIEKSGKLSAFREVYTSILTASHFEKCLKSIAKLNQQVPRACLLTVWEDEGLKSGPSALEKFLKLSGLSVTLQKVSPSTPLSKLFQDKYVLVITSKEGHLKQLNTDLPSLMNGQKGPFLLYNPEKKKFENLKVNWNQEGEGGTPFNPLTLYSVTFEILKKLLPHIEIEKIAFDFKAQFENIEKGETPHLPKASYKAFAEDKFVKINSTLKKEGSKMALGISILLLSLAGLFIYSQAAGKEIFPSKHGQGTGKAIRSDLIIPIDSVLIDRPELMRQIEDRFQGWRGIQTVALIGMEGSGKTTLARRYARSQELTNYWEINAETKESLNESFETLAESLSKTDQDRKILTGIQDIKDIAKREEQLLHFVKDRLRAAPNWFLFYDNVERFADIQNYFPKDPGKWGQGRVILTTRDGNVENNKHVNNVILIGELSPEEKLNLFLKIMHKGEQLSLEASKKEEAQKFLSKIPPFPLDVSAAAHYLRSTPTSYKNYLENIEKCNKEFSKFQKKILQESGEYSKTRYGIITLTVKQIIDAHKDFRALLLLISLVDSQNIPRELLIKYRDDVVVDNFIYTLKKHSLLTNNSKASRNSDSVFSIHRSIQSVIRAHLLKAMSFQEKGDLILSLSDILENYMNSAVEREDFVQMKALSRHAEQLLNNEKLLLVKETVSLRGELGCIYCYLGDNLKAQRYLNQSLENIQPVDKHNYHKVAHFYICLGNANKRLGDFDQAKMLFEKSLETYKKLEEPHIGMARAYGYMGVVNEGMGNFVKARALLEESLSIYENHQLNRIGLAWALTHLASVYRNLGDYQKAKELLERGLQIYKTFSETYVGAAWACGSLGNIYTQLGEFKKAKDILEESLKIYSLHFYEDHVYVAKANIQLGNFYSQIGDYEKAKNYLKKGLITIEGAYGKDHNETGSALKYLGHAYLLEGNLASAEEVSDIALRIFETNHHPERYFLYEQLGDIYLKKAENEKAKAQEAGLRRQKAGDSYKQALEIAKLYFPENSPHILRIGEKLEICNMDLN